MGEGDEELPRDAKIVKTLLKSMGVDEYEPRVIHQFLELWYRYVVDVLTDAQLYSDHAAKTTIDSDDVKLAIQSKVNFSFSQPPPRELLLELARTRNSIPLPRSLVGPGIPLPPEQDTLIKTNYQLAIPKKRSSHVLEESEEEEDDENNNNNNNNNDVDEEEEAVHPAPPQQRTNHDIPQSNPQHRVSFPIGAKRPR